MQDYLNIDNNICNNIGEEMSENKFGIIVADPPWSFNYKLTMSNVKRGAAANYPTLNVRRIQQLPIEDLAADNCVLALWIPSALLADGIATMEAWGFTYKQLWTWVKTSKNDPAKLAFGMGRLARNCHEPLLVGTRGKYTKELQNKSQRNVFMAPNLGHSRKPENIQDSLELMFPDWNKLELFARRKREGWTCLGNECPTSKDEDIRDSIGKILNS